MKKQKQKRKKFECFLVISKLNNSHTSKKHMLPLIYISTYHNTNFDIWMKNFIV